MVPPLVMLDFGLDLGLDFWEALDFSTPLEKFSGFWGLGVCYGVEQGARIGVEIYGLCPISEESPRITVELFLLSSMVPLSDFPDFSDFLDVFDASCIFDIIFF